MKGRKRHVLVDTFGFVLNVVVSEAKLNDRLLMPGLLHGVQAQLPRLRLVWADGGYRNDALMERIFHRTGIQVVIVNHRTATTGFERQPNRWIVERTFAWFGNARRLSKDYELYFKSSAAMIYTAMIRLMLRRLAHFGSPP